jgi:hypothetical protein
MPWAVIDLHPRQLPPQGLLLDGKHPFEKRPTLQLDHPEHLNMTGRFAEEMGRYEEARGAPRIVPSRSSSAAVS